MDPIRVFVVDDHPMCRRGLAAMLEADHLLDWVGEARSVDEALVTAPPARPDVVVLDMEIPGTDAVATMDALRPLLPRARWVLISGRLDPANVRRVLAAGAMGVLMKTASAQALCAAVRAAHLGGRVSSPEVSAALTATAPLSRLGADLTQRELELLGLLACGLGNEDISARLAIAIPTVKFHVTNILSKLQAANRTAAVLAALRHRVLVLEELQA